MKLNELAKPVGVYVAVRPTEKTIKDLKKYILENEIDNPIEDHEFHATILYSHVPVKVESNTMLSPEWKGEPTELEIWESPANSNKKEATKCVVLKFKCPEIVKRHKELIKDGGTHGYDDFRPHLTLSYDVCPDLKSEDLPEYEGVLEFDEEYSEPLNPGKVYKKK